MHTTRVSARTAIRVAALIVSLAACAAARADPAADAVSAAPPPSGASSSLPASSTAESKLAPLVVAAAPAPVSPPPPPPIMPFDEAVQFAAKALFGKADLERFGAARDDATRIPLVIDPLVDGNTGFQSTATARMQERIATLVREAYPRFDLQPFTTATLARGPLLFIGTFTAVDKDGKAEGPRDWYRVCLALVDLRNGRIVSKGFARSAVAGVDTTPAAFFADSPAWAPDAATQGYVKTCQGTKPGDPINPAYWDRIIAAAMVNDATIAYNAGRYQEALDLYKGVQRLPGGDQLRVHNGIYLSATKLGRRDDAVQAFARLVDFGLAQKQLGVKFLFRPGSTQFLGDPLISGPYPLWLSLLAQRAGRRADCIEVGGHTSRTGPEPVNDRLSLQRAQSIKVRIDALVPDLANRTTAIGKGSRENISGLGTDDVRDALDRRVEFKIRDCRGS